MPAEGLLATIGGRTGRRWPWLVVALAVVIACRKLHHFFLTYAPNFSGGKLYVYYIMVPNYFNSGFVRRGLANTVFALINSGRIAPDLAIYQVIGAVFCAVPLGLLLGRLAALDRRHWWWFAGVLALSPQLFFARSLDVGRVDLFTYGFLAWATIAALDRRYIVAGAALVIGSLSHETALFFGAPLVVAIGFVDARAGAVPVRRLLAALAAFVAMVAAVTVAQALFSATPAATARLIAAAGPASFGRDIADYMTVGGLRSITSSACMSFSRPAVALDLVACFLTAVAYFVVLLARTRRTIALFAFVVLVPLVAISVVAVDYGRWLSLAVMNAWLIAVALRLQGAEPVAQSRQQYLRAALMGGILALLGPNTVFFADKAVETLAHRLWAPRANEMIIYIAQCDPGWRSVIGL